jgi:hypothetical protein
MEDFCNVLVSIEFKSSLLSKGIAFQYMPGLVDILCYQSTDQEQILEQVYDSLSGILDQYNSKIFDLPSKTVIKANKKLIDMTTQIAKKAHDQKSTKTALDKLDSVIEIIYNCIKHPEAPDFYLRQQCTNLLNSLHQNFLSQILTQKESEITKNLCYEPDNFMKITLILESMQSVPLNPSNLPNLLNLIHKLGNVISEVGVNPDWKSQNDPIQLLVVLVNITQTTIGKLAFTI